MRLGAATLLVGLLSAIAPSAAIGLSFSGPSSFPVDSAPKGIATGDFNRDGKTDIAVANSGSNDVSVLFGAGGGIFTAPNNFATGTQPNSISAADFTGDGFLDLVTTNRGSSNVSLLRGNGGGGFLPALSYATVDPPYWAVPGDFTEDGALDLAVTTFTTTSPYSAHVQILRGDGSGGLAPLTLISEPAEPRELAAADLSGLEHLDLAVVDRSNFKAFIYRGDGAGGFYTNPVHRFGTGELPESIDVGDLNGDFDDDLVVSNPYDGNVSVLLGNRTVAADFQPQTVFDSGAPGSPPSGAASSVKIGDLNGDGKQDLVVANPGIPYTGYVAVLLGTGSGSFLAHQDFAGGLHPRKLAVADFNGDSHPDIAFTDDTANNVSVLLNSSFAGYPRPKGATPVRASLVPAFRSCTPPNGQIAFASNRDGDNDVYTMNPDGSGQANLSAFQGDGDTDEFPAWSPNGSKVAFQSTRDGNGEIYVMNRDGTGQTRLTNDPHLDDNEPSWSPDGSKIAFTTDRDGNYEIYVMNADGSAQTRITSNPALDSDPTWSPDGSKIAFVSNRDAGNVEVYEMNANGTAQTRITNNPAWDADPAWSPNGSKIAFASDRTGTDFDIYTMNVDGTNVVKLTTTGAHDGFPAWSPDGSKIAFQSNRDDYDIYVMNADGSGETNLTRASTSDESAPSWQPVAAKAHGAPLSFPSCGSPTQVSTFVTVGTPDANGATANAVGHISLAAGINPAPAPNDLLIGVAASDVRCKPLAGACGSSNSTGGPDYTGQLLANTSIRVTDRNNSEVPGGGTEAATVPDVALSAAVPCAVTSNTAIGGSCTLSTSANSITPGFAQTGKRAVIQLGQAQLFDGGRDSVASTAGNSLFEVQGVFVP